MQKLPLVQVLRALAALAVVVHHARYDAALLAERTGAAFAAKALLPWMAGVDVFFVISGFIMVHASAALFARPGGAQIFLARRIARIVPLYWTVTTVYLAVALVVPSVLNSEGPTLWQTLASYLFLPARRADGLVQPVYSLGWTLNYEMFFYVLFAAAIALPRTRAVAAVAATLALLVLAGRLVPLPLPLAFWSDPIVLEFVFGMGLGLIWAQGMRFGRAARLALAAAALGLLSMDLLAKESSALPQVIAYGVPAAMLVAAATLGREGAHHPALERMFVALGDASYAIYLVHPFVIRAARELFARTPLGSWLGPEGFVAAALALAVLAALAVHRSIERPLTAALRRRLGLALPERRFGADGLSGQPDRA